MFIFIIYHGCMFLSHVRCVQMLASQGCTVKLCRAVDCAEDDMETCQLLDYCGILEELTGVPLSIITSVCVAVLD